MDLEVVAISLASGSSIGLIILFSVLINVFKKAPKLKESIARNEKPLTSLTIIIPCYNEEAKIRIVLESLIKSEPPCKIWKIIVVDDCSTDSTKIIANELKSELRISSKKLEIISAGIRPLGQRWVGKNWACSQAMENISSEWVLFIDADVELEVETLKRSLQQAINEEIDLLSLAPRIICSCFSEWTVQPIIAMLLAIGFPISRTNDPEDQAAFAAGPYMLFRKEAYDAIGGHKNIASEVVEDILLAKLIKSNDFKLKFLMGLDAVKLRMYSNFSELWEGWTKNWFLGLNKNILKAILASLVIFLTFSIPWLMAITLPFLIYIKGYFSIFTLGTTFLILASIYLQFGIRYWCKSKFNLSMKYWYLMGIGGVVISCISISSIWKTTTGFGWTWKGRGLA